MENISFSRPFFHVLMIDMIKQRSLKILISLSKCDENHNIYLSLSLFVYISV